MAESGKNIDVREILTIELRQNKFGSSVMQLRPSRNIRSLYGHERKAAVLLYEIAAEVERRCDALDLRFAVSPEAHDFRLTIEIGDNDDPEVASQLALSVLEDFEVPYVTDRPRQKLLPPR